MCIRDRIHGGLRYLEHYKFRLVQESLKEREVLLKMAPHIIWPMRFVLPHSKGMRPAWLLRLGLALYDHLGFRKILPGTSSVNLNKSAGVFINPSSTNCSTNLSPKPSTSSALREAKCLIASFRCA